jgi:hypothetical protein
MIAARIPAALKNTISLGCIFASPQVLVFVDRSSFVSIRLGSRSVLANFSNPLVDSRRPRSRARWRACSAALLTLGAGRANEMAGTVALWPSRPRAHRVFAVWVGEAQRLASELFSATEAVLVLSWNSARLADAKSMLFTERKSYGPEP